MAKKKAKLTADSLAQQVVDRRLKKHGHMYRTSEHKDFTYGVPIPKSALAFMWMIGGINVLTLGRIIGGSGPPSSFKSALTDEIATWFLHEGGVAFTIDSEQKSSASMLEAFKSCLDDEVSARWQYEPVESLEAWQRTATDILSMLLDDEVKALKKGNRIPGMVVVDSIVARAAESQKKSIEEEGAAAERGFATQNNVVKKYLEALDLSGSSTMFFYVAHQKDEQNDSSKRGHGPTPQKELGGRSVMFYATTHIRCKAGGEVEYTDEDGLRVQGQKVTLTCFKSCSGPSKRTITVPVLWRYVEDDTHSDGFRQEMWFDWYWALGHLLWRFLYDDKFTVAAERNLCKDAIPCNKAGSGSFTSPKFVQPKTKVPSADGEVDDVRAFGPEVESLGMHEFGKAIVANPELWEKLRKMLRVTQFRGVQEIEHMDPRVAK